MHTIMPRLPRIDHMPTSSQRRFTAMRRFTAFHGKNIQVRRCFQQKGHYRERGEIFVGGFEKLVVLSLDC